MNNDFKQDTISVIKIVTLFLVLILISLSTVKCCAQNWSVKLGIGYVQPIERTFADIELCHKIAPYYSLAIATELSYAESNISPKLITKLTNNLSLETGFGWGHHWQKANCDDHNYHTYTIGLAWQKQIKKHIAIFCNPSMFWRSYQAHIGFHRGTLRFCAGIIYII